MSKTKKAYAFAFAEDYVMAFIDIVSAMILARLLTPEEFGIFAIPTVILMLAHRLRDFGITEYLIQSKDVEPKVVRSALALTMGMALILWAGIMAGSGWVAEFYELPVLVPLFWIISISFLLLPFSSVHVALLKREMSYEALYRVNTIAALSRAVVSVALAAWGFGVFSLAWGALVQVVMTVILVQLFRPAGSPLLPGFGACRQIVSFGGHVTFASLMTTAGNAAPRLVIGKVLGAAPLGYFSRAFSLSTLFQNLVMSPINNVSLPDLSERRRAGEDFLDYYVGIAKKISGLAWPFFGYAGLMAPPVIQTLYGDQWDLAEPVMAILCIGAMLRFVNPLWNRIYLAMGEARRYNMLMTIRQAIGVTFICAAVSFGLEAVAWSIAAAALVEMLLVLRGLHRLTGLAPATIFRAHLPSATVTLVSLAPVLIAVQWFDYSDANPDWFLLFLGTCLAFSAWYVLVIFATRHPLTEIAEMVLAEGRRRLAKALPRLGRSRHTPGGG